MINKPNHAIKGPSRVFLTKETSHQFFRQSRNDSKGKYGASGYALCNDTDQLIPPPPRKNDQDSDGDFIYEHDESSVHLSDRGHRDFNMALNRCIIDNKERQNNDTNLYWHLLDGLSADSSNLIELQAGYAFFLEQPEGDQSIPFFRLIVASHSIKDTMTQFQSTLTWLGTQHVEGASLVETFQSINAGCEDLLANFCGPDGLLDPKIMASMLSVACLPKHKFSHFIHQLFFNRMLTFLVTHVNFRVIFLHMSRLCPALSSQRMHLYQSKVKLM
jgi:hypothetical protein